MNMRRHISSEPSPTARGIAFGSAQRLAVRSTVAAYRRLFDASGLSRREVRCFGEAVGEHLRASYPDLYQEISGLAVGSQQNQFELLALNARTELLAGWSGRECSVAAILPQRSASGHCLMAQNWDWYPELADSLVCWTIVTPEGGWLTTVTEAGILAKIGINSRGVACCLNILETTADGETEGVPIHILLRLILSKCSTAGEALRLLSESPHSASSCITVGSSVSGSEQLLCLELSPGGLHTVEPDPEGWLAHTNHFLVPPAIPEGHKAECSANSVTRLGELRRWLAGHAGEIATADLQDLMRSHANTPDSICRHVDEVAPRSERTATLASVTMDLDDRQLWLTKGNPCSAPSFSSTGPEVSGP